MDGDWIRYRGHCEYCYWVQTKIFKIKMTIYEIKKTCITSINLLVQRDIHNAVATKLKKNQATETAGVAADTEFDLVILNGRVIDPETNFDDIRNVGVIDGRIAVITEESISGKETVDATGKIVAPGFIDTHFHFQTPIGYSLGLRDGLTSSMDFEMGCAGSYVDRWYEARAGMTQANYGIAVSHEFARAMFIDGSDGADYLVNGPIAAYTTRAKTGWSQTRPTLEQGNAILQEIDKGLQAGAVGIGSTVGYMREGVSSREMFEVQKVGARYGRATGAHTRYTLGNDTEENNGAQELIANAMVLGAPANRRALQQPWMAPCARNDYRTSSTGPQYLG